MRVRRPRDLQPRGSIGREVRPEKEQRELEQHPDILPQRHTLEARAANLAITTLRLS